MQYIVKLGETETKCKNTKEFHKFVRKNFSHIDDMVLMTSEREELSPGEAAEVLDQACQEMTGIHEVGLGQVV